MIHVMARITLRSEAAASGLALFEEIAAAMGAVEPARPCCEVFRRQDAPHALCTIERRADRAGFDAHMASAHVARDFAVATPLLAGPPESLVFEPVARPPEAA